ncbi:unnamed protein product [Cylicocyclus nassatus]|uniref:Uncharacterized protein n=1 Tax=Cylicocyclus nassatus TaxID=53992 RepID=A0AA36HE47_CYLNA|nr:unnamed protein product [Cylicocyclus nassatus]
MSKNYICFVCGNKNEARFATRTSQSPVQNAVFLAALRLDTTLAEETLKIYFATFKKSQKFICTGHFINAAQYLIDEIVASGGELSKTAEDVSYINYGEISAHLVNNLNDARRLFDAAAKEGPSNAEVAEAIVAKAVVDEPMDCSVSAPTSGSSSSYCPDEQPDYDTDDGPTLEETKPELLNKFFVVQGKKLLELFHLTRCECESDETRVCLDASGSNPIIYYLRKGVRPQKKRWDGQEKINSDRIDKLRIGDALACIGSVTTGVRMNVKLCSFPDQTSKYTVPEIDKNDGGAAWDIAVDGAYDSRGHSAELCKVLAVDLKTKLCIHSEVVNRSETGQISQRMEKEGFRRMLRWLHSRGIPIRSIATDRSAVFGKEINLYNAECGEKIEWKLDRCHLARNLDKNLRAAAKKRDYAVIKSWIKPIKKHLYFAIEQGALANDSKYAKYLFNSCLYHVADQHTWDQADITGPLRRCSQEALDVDEDDDEDDDEEKKPIIPFNSPAHNKLREILLQPLFRKDIPMASPLGETSQCETKNALDRLYCPKDTFLPAATYSIYAHMSTMHFNALTQAELSGERVVERVDEVRRKCNGGETTQLKHKSAVEHIWRKEIVTAFITRRSQIRIRDNEDTADGTPD